MPFELTRCGGQPHGRQADTWWDWGCTDRVREPRTPAQVDLGTGQHPKGTEGHTQGTSWLPQRLLSGPRILGRKGIGSLIIPLLSSVYIKVNPPS